MALELLDIQCCTVSKSYLLYEIEFFGLKLKHMATNMTHLILSR